LVPSLVFAALREPAALTGPDAVLVTHEHADHIDELIYHPGDSLHVPEQPIETLLAPAQGSWMKTAEAIDFVKAIKPQRAFAIHDAQINDRGLSSVNGWLTEETDHGYRYLRPGESF
jgi:L-ascorbate metabolism protein UlaG (beta-lactamase superfamily)